MPIDFSDSQHNFQSFGNSGFATRNNPQDNNDTVGQFNNDGSDANQGFYIDLTSDINLDAEKIITLSFYSFDPNSHSILLKLENGTNADIQVKETFTVPSPSNWKTITFDFSNAQFSSNGNTTNGSGNYNRLTIFIDAGVTTAGTYLINDISDGSTPTDPNVLDVTYTDLVWADEFDTNGAIDETKWFHQTQLPAGGSWYNGEVQHYTNRIENSNVNNGSLNIVAIKENFNDQGQTKQYTSARLNSKFAFTYGRVDVKAKLPFGNGTWPAIWTLGKNINEDGGFWDNQFGTTNWPGCGEIDVMEHGLHAVNQVSSALHTPSSFGNTMNTATKSINNVADNFHIYSMNWSPDQITFLIDDIAYYTYKPSTKNSSTWPFDNDQYLLLNIAMGGIAGAIDANFTQSSMIIDYVRVYQNTSTASVDEVFDTKFSVYPNPSSEFITIKTNENIRKIELYSKLGQLIIKEKASKNINIKSLNTGLYLLKIYSGDKIITKKIVVKN